MHDPESDIRDIPLSQLELSPDNVRKTPADNSAFTELKASIAAHGLLENLIARAMEPGPDGIGRYAVIAGGRRLAAMQALAAEGALEEDHPVPCRMIEDIVAAEEVSLAEVFHLGRDLVDAAVEALDLGVQCIDEAPEQALAFVGELRAVRCDRAGQNVDRFLDPGKRLVFVPDLAVVELIRTRGGAKQSRLPASHCGL